jgi:hypothetical protein
MGSQDNKELQLPGEALIEPAGAGAPHAALVTRMDPQETLEYYRSLVKNAIDVPALAKMSVAGQGSDSKNGPRTKPQSDLLPPSKNQQPEAISFDGQTLIGYPDSSAIRLDDDGRVREIKAKTMKLEDVDYDNGQVDKFKLNGIKYELKDGTFHYKNKDGKDVDTGWSQAMATADGTFITKDKNGKVTLSKRDGAKSVLEGADVSIDKKGNLTIERADKSKEVLTANRGLIEIDEKGHVRDIFYPNGDKRSFGYKDNQLVSIKDIDGKSYHLDNGRWLDQNGNDTGRSNVFVAADGTYGFRKNDSKIEVTEPGGKVNKLEENDLGKDALLYPDAQKRVQENERIRKLISDKGGLTDSGKTIIADARTLGLDDTDLFHGSHVFLENAEGKGDGGELYRKWKELDGAESRTSSHQSSETQYQIKVGPGDAVVLFGITPSGNTWFQLERHPGRTGDLLEKGASGAKTGIGNLFHGDLSFDDAHGRDFDLYKKIRQNIGPFGVSPHSDRNPVHIDWKR